LYEQSVVTVDNMFKTVSDFFDDTKNKAFTSADENWWFVHNFTRTIFPHNKGHPRSTLSNVLEGPFGNEIKPFVKYVKTSAIPTELFPNGGSKFTPVMTIIGLQKFVTRLPKNNVSAQLRDIADQAFALWMAGDKPFIESARANAASSAPIPQLYREAIAQERAAKGVFIAEEPRRDKEAHALEVETMKIAFDRQGYAFEQDKLKAEEDKKDRDTARKNEERKTAAYESFMETKKAAAAAKEAKLQEEAKVATEQAKVATEQAKKTALEATMIAFDLEQKKASVAAEAAKSVTLSPPSTEKAKTASTPKMPPLTSTKKASSNAGIRKPTSSRAKKGARGPGKKCTKPVRGKDVSTVIHVTGQTTISFPKTPRMSRT
jgi:hypothetical protein